MEKEEGTEDEEEMDDIDVDDLDNFMKKKPELKI